MSFIDPDLRETWHKADQAKAAAAEKLKKVCENTGGHVYDAHVCTRCGVKDMSPRVIMENATHRAVFVPQMNHVAFETKGKDAKGDVAWRELTTLYNNGIYSKESVSLAFLYNLITEGK